VKKAEGLKKRKGKKRKTHFTHATRPGACHNRSEKNRGLEEEEMPGALREVEEKRAQRNRQLYGRAKWKGLERKKKIRHIF